MTFWEYLGPRYQQLLGGAFTMALITDWLGTLAELPLRPRGLEVD